MRRSDIFTEFVTLLGPEKADRFIAHYGGKQLTIPFGKRRDGAFVLHLIELLGEEGFKSLSARFGGENLTIPRNKAAAFIARNKKIIADYNSGARMLELIKRYDLSERQIRTILNREIE